ncbi:MAG: hypothetical protein H7Z16_00820 [Pyrinomonadaceae bacterium]|nr:hypothetical protein [Pyrinomonadaceae bacterium]
MKKIFAALNLSVVVSGLCMTTLAQAEMHGGVPPYGPTHVGYEAMYDRPFRSPYVPREPRVIKKGTLAPSVDDRTAFATLLKDKHAGLIRLLPREALERATKQAKKELFKSAGGAFFSFANRTHANGYGSDIGFAHNNLSVGFRGFDYGMLTNLGNAPLEQITLSDTRVRAIAALRPSHSQSEAQSEYRRIKSTEGLTFDGSVYRNQLPVQENSTYLLRSIVYRKSDVLVAFRLVRKDTDGSVIIAWKLLQQYPTPKLERPGKWDWLGKLGLRE